MQDTDRQDEGFNAISLEIYWNRLISIADEAAAGLVRTAFSTIVRESNDYATVLMDRNGDSIAENSGGLASFSCILPKTTKSFLEKFPADTWQPGDSVITNDPWLATGHLPDFTVVTGIFHRGKLVGFSGCVAHSPDVGGALWSADCQELFEEGIHINPVHLVKKGTWNQELTDILLANVRVPRQVLGDLQAQVSSNEVGARRIAEFLEDTGLEDLQALSSALQARADQAMRRAIRELPDGIYRGGASADGIEGHETQIVCTVTVAGDTIDIDYEGTSPQVSRGINCVLNYTHAYSVYPIKCALDPLVPRNEGSYRAITVRAPTRSILNPEYPAPVSARQLTGHFLAGAVYSALANIIPEKVIAECGGAPTLRALFSGTDNAGDRFSQVLFASGGMGASQHRDGLSVTAFPTNVGAGSIEAFEAVSPLIVWRKELLPDSGGPGAQRGGLGQLVEIENPTEGAIRLSLLSDRHQHPATGLKGGQPGSPSRIELSRGGIPHPKARTVIGAGERISMNYAGGGGFGKPEDRDPEAIRADVEHGYVTAEAAKTIYHWSNK
ncbi:hydantoin utilization protein B [Rhizobium sp. ACO-34A]|nr:hydantoin utilization protein B [Rhizobium sp. ACO-34A]